MSYLTGIVGIVDAQGNRVDAQRSDGTRGPILLELAAGLTATSSFVGGLTKVSVTAEGNPDGEVQSQIFNVAASGGPDLKELSEITLPDNSYLYVDLFLFARRINGAGAGVTSCYRIHAYYTKIAGALSHLSSQNDFSYAGSSSVTTPITASNNNIAFQFTPGAAGDVVLRADAFVIARDLPALP